MVPQCGAGKPPASIWVARPTDLADSGAWRAGRAHCPEMSATPAHRRSVVLSGITDECQALEYSVEQSGLTVHGLARLAGLYRGPRSGVALAGNRIPREWAGNPSAPGNQ
jgi:hypothetical protein